MCEDPRDRIYGLLGLATDASDFPVDYSESLYDLYFRAFSKYKSVSEAGRIITQHLGICDEDMISWMEASPSIIPRGKLLVGQNIPLSDPFSGHVLRYNIMTKVKRLKPVQGRRIDVASRLLPLCKRCRSNLQPSQMYVYLPPTRETWWVRLPARCSNSLAKSWILSSDAKLNTLSDLWKSDCEWPWPWPARLICDVHILPYCTDSDCVQRLWDDYMVASAQEDENQLFGDLKTVQQAAMPPP